MVNGVAGCRVLYMMQDPAIMAPPRAIIAAPWKTTKFTTILDTSQAAKDVLREVMKCFYYIHINVIQVHIYECLHHAVSFTVK